MLPVILALIGGLVAGGGGSELGVFDSSQEGASTPSTDVALTQQEEAVPVALLQGENATAGLSGGAAIEADQAVQGEKPVAVRATTPPVPPTSVSVVPQRREVRRNSVVAKRGEAQPAAKKYEVSISGVGRDGFSIVLYAAPGEDVSFPMETCVPYVVANTGGKAVKGRACSHLKAALRLKPLNASMVQVSYSVRETMLTGFVADDSKGEGAQVPQYKNWQVAHRVAVAVGHPVRTETASGAHVVQVRAMQ
jgi:hypothetical protein